MSRLSEAGVGSSGIAGGRMNTSKRSAQRLSPLEKPGWDDLIMTHPEASFFHSARWAEVLRDTYNHSPCYFCAMVGERLSAALPVMEVNSSLTGRRGVSLPFTDECALLSEDSALAQGVFQNAINFGRNRKWKYLECRGARKLTAEAASPSLTFFGHVLPLSDHEDRIFSRLDGSMRRGIRKAEKSEVRVEISESFDSVLVYYALHCKSRKRHGLPPQSVAFFQSIFQHVLSKGMGFIVVARFRDNPVAAAMFFHFSDKAIYKFGASDWAFQSLRGNNLVIWEAIKWCRRSGYASLYFGRTSIANEGLRRFKLGFGAEEYKIDYFKYDFSKEAFVADRDKVSGWYNRVFHLMPIPLSRIMGQMLYRHLS